jgi:hypothetical protein
MNDQDLFSLGLTVSQLAAETEIEPPAVRISVTLPSGSGHELSSTENSPQLLMYEAPQAANAAVALSSYGRAAIFYVVGSRVARGVGALATGAMLSLEPVFPTCVPPLRGAISWSSDKRQLNRLAVRLCQELVRISIPVPFLRRHVAHHTPALAPRTEPLNEERVRSVLF